MSIANYMKVPSALDVQIGGDHYKTLGIQPITYCMANGLNACESSIVRYITRWHEKGGVQDLLKIKHYVDLLIELDPRAKATAHVALAKEAIRAAQEEPLRPTEGLFWDDEDEV